MHTQWKCYNWWWCPNVWRGVFVLVTINEWRPNYCPNSPLGTDGKVRRPPAPLWDQRPATHTFALTYIAVKKYLPPSWFISFWHIYYTWIGLKHASMTNMKRNKKIRKKILIHCTVLNHISQVIQLEAKRMTFRVFLLLQVSKKDKFDAKFK